MERAYPTTSVLGAAFAAAGLTLLVQSFYSLRGGATWDPWGLVGHLYAILGFQLVLAILLGWSSSARAWSGATFALPVVLALVPGRLFASLPTVATRIGVVLGAVVFVIAVARRRVRWRSSPVVSAVAGALLAAELLRFRLDHFVGLSTPPGSLLRPALMLAAALAVTRCVGRAEAWQSRSWAAYAGLACLGFTGATGVHVLRLARPSPPAGRAEALRNPPAVLIVLDTVRADHLKSYGYARDTMPRLEEFARRYCVRAARCVAVHPSSLETHASFFTGLVPPRHGAHRPSVAEKGFPRYAHPLGTAQPTLAELLAQAGYWSVGISANSGPLGPHFGLGRGFHFYRAQPDAEISRSPWHAPFSILTPGASAALLATPPFGWSDFFLPDPQRTASSIANEAIAIVDGAQGRSFFLFLNFFDAHGPNLAPAPYFDAFDGRSPESRLDGSYESLIEADSGRHVLTDDERRHLNALYDGELSYMDQQLARVFDRLRAHPQWEDMLVIVTADHGESLGERGLVGHGQHVTEEQTAVPLFIKPGRRVGGPAAPSVDSEHVYQSVDVFPLVLRHASLGIPDGIDGRLWAEGRTESRAWAYRAAEHARLNPARFDRDLRSIQSGSLKVVASSNGADEAYDLASDPGELSNLVPQGGDLYANLRARLEETTPVQVPVSQEESAEVRERLRALGYVQ